MPRVLLLSRSPGGGIMWERALSLARHAGPRVQVEVVPRPTSMAGYTRLCRRMATGDRADAVYLFDVNPRELVPATFAGLRGVPVIVEVGDLTGELLAATGARGPRLAYRRAVERAAWRRASVLAVRGPGYVPALRERGVTRPIEVVPEGVDPSVFRPLDPSPWRDRLGLRGPERAVGVVGTIVWNPVTEVAYGWELVDALPGLPREWKAVIVGDGDGIGRLRERAAGLGLADRLVTPGRVPKDELPGVLAALDAVTWTQTPDRVGMPRTTVKLPEYLACGKYILASDVGAARELVHENGMRLPYVGGRDPDYARAIASAVAGLPDRAELDRLGATGIERSVQFSWDVVAERFCEVVEMAVGR